MALLIKSVSLDLLILFQNFAVRFKAKFSFFSFLKKQLSSSHYESIKDGKEAKGLGDKATGLNQSDENEEPDYEIPTPKDSGVENNLYEEVMIGKERHGNEAGRKERDEEEASTVLGSGIENPFYNKREVEDSEQPL